MEGETFMDTKAHKFTVGSIECIPVADGTYLYTADALFANAPKETAEQVVREHGLQPEEMVLSYTALVIDTGEHRVLVDTGLGAGVAPSAGALSQGLAALGISVDDVDTVILTHGHPDHIGGNLGGESRPAFPNARYVMWSADWDFWTSESTLEKFAAGQMYGVAEVDQWIGEAAKTSLPPIQAQLELIERETEIVPGVHALPAPGHTPGHMGLVISSGDEQALHIADAVLHPIHLEQPDWYPLYDIDADEAAATRRRLLDRAAAEQCMVIAYHFPVPSTGRIAQRAKGWAWEPL
jgi:glyoxylase-like metal-dependent hydrolase (beta-lactamase superfamily II)